MWYFIGNKKNKRWIGNAVDRKTGHLLAWEWGCRDRSTLEKFSAWLFALRMEIYHPANGSQRVEPYYRCRTLIDYAFSNRVSQ
jgi:IS1 family transposase